MERHEMAGCLNKIKRIFDRFVVSEEMLELWQKLVGQHYSEAEFQKGLEQYLAGEDRTPTIASIRKILESRYGQRQNTQAEMPKVVSKPSEIDYCMDMLGAAEVNRRIRALLKAPASAPTVLSLLKQKGWIPEYRKLLAEMVAEAREVEQRFGNNQQGGWL